MILHAWETARIFVSTLVQAIVQVHVLAHQWDPIQVHPTTVVRNVKTLVHQRAKVIVVLLVQMLVRLLVKVVAKKVANPAAKEVVIQDVRIRATTAAPAHVIQDVRVHVKAVAKELAKGIARDLVRDHVKTHANSLALLVVIHIVRVHVWGHVYIVADGAAQTISIISEVFVATVQ